MTRFAAKRLSSVELGGRSTQHEFHGSAIRKVLGFGERTKGALTVLIYKGSEPLVIESDYTIYDAREGTLRTEWRLYYTTDAIEKHAKAEDLLLLVRPDDNSTDLQAVIAPKDSHIEIQLRNAFSIGDHATL